jgi:hypothetical protein
MVGIRLYNFIASVEKTKPDNSHGSVQVDGEFDLME